MTASPLQISQLLIAWSNGDQTAFDRLMPVVYNELRRIARRYMLGQPVGHPLQINALNHEAYLKLWVKMRSGGSIFRRAWRRGGHSLAVTLTQLQPSSHRRDLAARSAA